MSDREVLAWKEPPPSRGVGRKSTWSKVARQLQERPGQWALIDDCAATTATANHITQGKIEDFRPAGSFEATGRRVPDTIPPVLHVYARYVGEPAEVRSTRAEALRALAERFASAPCCDVHGRLSPRSALDWSPSELDEYQRHASCYFTMAHAVVIREIADRVEKGEPI